MYFTQTGLFQMKAVFITAQEFDVMTPVISHFRQAIYITL